MGGNWSPPPNLPIRPGSYVNFESSGATPIQPGTFGRVAIPVKATWGPSNDFVDLVTDADRRKAFGPVGNYDFVNNAIVGTPTGDTSWLIAEAIRGGSELVKAYRMVGAGAAKATVTLNDWLGAGTLVLEAKYEGTRGNGFTATISASPVFTGKNILSISEGGVALEEWLYSPDDLGALVLDLNDSINGSTLVSASFDAGADPEVSEETTISNLGTANPLTGGDFEIVIDFGDGQGPQTSSSVVWSASAEADIQTAVDSCLTAANYSAGDLVVALTNGVSLDDVAGAEFTVTALSTGPLTNQNIAVSIADADSNVAGAELGDILVTTVTAGTRSPLAYGSFAMTGGNDGAAITLGDYTDALAAFEAEGGFDLLALDGVSEEDFVGVDAAVAAWAITNNEAGRYVMAVVGGGATEQANSDIASALSRSALYDTEWVVNIGCTGLNVVSPCGVVLGLTPAQCAARMAGRIAAAGIIGSVTFSEVTDVDSVSGPVTPSQIEQMIQQGVVVFSKRGSAVRIEDGVTTFISLTTEKDFTFTQVRAVRAIQQIGMDISEIVERDWIGKKLNTTTVRDSLVATLQQYFNQLEAQGVLVNGTQISIDARYDNTKTNVFVLVLAQFQFELKRVLLTVRVPTVS